MTADFRHEYCDSFVTKNRFVTKATTFRCANKKRQNMVK